MKKFGLLGEKLAHSLSPEIHALLGGYEYNLYETAPADLADFLEKGDFDGLNVTIPYKKAAMPFCAELSDRAARIGSLNTLLRRPGGGLYGHNTDYGGFLHLVGTLGVDVSGKKAVIFGSGGSSLALRAVLEDLGAAPIVTVSRTGDDNYDNLSRHGDAHLVVNATPVGMYPQNGAAPAGLSPFLQCRAVIDIVYNPYATALLLEARERGIPHINGLPMLVAQAAESSALFTGVPVDDEAVNRITDKLARSMRNVVLIGMPGSGKSETGAQLARITGRPFCDLDAFIEARSGRTISDIFERDGEAAFRRMETAALAHVTQGHGQVIATGGGVVTVPENSRLLRQNGVVVYLRRDAASLPTGGRPLSLRRGVAALAAERLPLYEALGDVTADARGVEQTAQYIRKALKL